jgi:hypothetical protein
LKSGDVVERWPCASTFSVDEFEERFLKAGAGGPSGTDRQPWADGFESRWDSFVASVYDRRRPALTDRRYSEWMRVTRVATKISLLTELSDGARLCPQDQSQRVERRRRLKIFCGVGLLVAVRKHLRPGVATTALPPQRGCSFLVAAFGRKPDSPGNSRWRLSAEQPLRPFYSGDEFGERFLKAGAGGPSGADRQPWAGGFEDRWNSQRESPNENHQLDNSSRNK